AERAPEMRIYGIPRGEPRGFRERRERHDSTPWNWHSALLEFSLGFTSRTLIQTPTPCPARGSHAGRFLPPLGSPERVQALPTLELRLRAAGHRPASS